MLTRVSLKPSPDWNGSNRHQNTRSVSTTAPAQVCSHTPRISFKHFSKKKNSCDRKNTNLINILHEISPKPSFLIKLQIDGIGSLVIFKRARILFQKLVSLLILIWKGRLFKVHPAAMSRYYGPKLHESKQHPWNVTLGTWKNNSLRITCVVMTSIYIQFPNMKMELNQSYLRKQIKSRNPITKI